MEIRNPDYDLEAAIRYNPQGFVVEDILTVLAEVPGANDEFDWHWIVQMKDGRFGYLVGGCDYTGWDCQSSLSSLFADSAEAAALLAPELEEYSNRRIRHFLLAQMAGSEPFGTYYRAAGED